MNEFLVKLIQNANNGGGNPYHDELGKFTSGPKASMGEYGMSAEERYNNGTRKIEFPKNSRESESFQKAHQITTIAADEIVNSKRSSVREEAYARKAINAAWQIKYSADNIAKLSGEEKTPKNIALINKEISKLEKQQEKLLKSIPVAEKSLKRKEKMLKSGQLSDTSTMREEFIGVYGGKAALGGINTLKYIAKSLTE